MIFSQYLKMKLSFSAEHNNQRMFEEVVNLSYLTAEVGGNYEIIEMQISHYII